jgi:hypothetical protein
MSSLLHFAAESLLADGGSRADALAVAPGQLVIAGWTGRDADAIRHHIDELAAVGVPPPSTVPLYYRASAQMLTQADVIEALGPDSSGEAEPVLMRADGQWWLTVGSDHTDRRVETYSVAVSKQMCAKPIARAAWRWDDVAAYQDEIELGSRILEDGRWVDYQRGTLASIRPLAQLLASGPLASHPDPAGAFQFCGTLGAIPNAQGAGIRAAAEMEIRLHDPRRRRSIVHRYAVRVLPVIA